MSNLLLFEELKKHKILVSEHGTGVYLDELFQCVGCNISRSDNILSYRIYSSYNFTNAEVIESHNLKSNFVNNDTSYFYFIKRNNNISIYKAFDHQHLQEIGQSMRQLQPGFDKAVNFIPVRGNFARGIYATSYINCALSFDDAQKLYKEYYQNAAFTFVVDKNPDMKQVVNTNKAIIYLEKHGDKLLIVSMIDNLLKGASGQAVQNFNLMFGLDEKAGLGLKSIGF